MTNQRTSIAQRERLQCSGTTGVRVLEDDLGTVRHGSFIAVIGAFFALGGHVYISASGASAGGAAESGMFAFRAAGGDKTDLGFEGDQMDAMTPGAARILIILLFAALFFGLSVLANSLPATGIVLVLVIVVLAFVLELDWGLTTARSK